MAYSDARRELSIFRIARATAWSRHISTCLIAGRSTIDASGQTLAAAYVIRRYRSCTPLSVARLSALYLTTKLGALLSAPAAPAAPAAKTPAKPPSTARAILARDP